MGNGGTDSAADGRDGGGAVDASPDRGALAALVALGNDVQHASRLVGSRKVTLPPALSEAKGVTIRPLGRQLQRELAALMRNVAETASDGASDTDALSADTTRRLRDVLEVAVGEPLTLPGEEPRVPVDSGGIGGSHGQQQTWTVRNLTDRELSLNPRRGGDPLIVPAFGERELNRDPRAALKLGRYEARDELEVVEPSELPTVSRDPLYFYVFVLLIAIPLLLWTGTWGKVVAVCLLIAPAAAVALSYARAHIESVRGVARELPPRLLQLVTFLIVVASCLAVPAAAIYWGADLQPIFSSIVDGEGTADDYLTIVYRSIQLVLISIVSVLPALLYYQFDRDRMSTLREKFVQQIFRLDSRLTTKGAIHARYGPLIDEIYGPERFGRYRRLPPGRRAPIFVATVLIMIGWLLVLLNPDVGTISASSSDSEVATLFEPRRTAPAFAFLGAYFFTLLALLRGYVRRDLRPKSYSDISVRIVTVVILAWVLELIWGSDPTALLVVAFLTGIVPQAGLTTIREFGELATARLRLRLSRPSAAAHGAGGEDPPDELAAALADPLPLTALEGIDLYDRTRLGSEGVTNVEALAHHDLIELMLLTRIPVPRLVDWTDQAILHLHVPKKKRDRLRGYGIRTASDLECASKDPLNREELARLLEDDARQTRRLEVVLSAIEDEEWMGCIRSWHGQPQPRRDHGTTVSASP